MIKTLIDFGTVLLWAIALHELGHYMYARFALRRRTRFNFPSVEYDGRADKRVASTGIIWGMIPCMFMPITFILYFGLCGEDLFEIFTGGSYDEFKIFKRILLHQTERSSWLPGL